MIMLSRTRNVQAEMLDEEALHELGEVLSEELDDYARQCDYAGCYPWLNDFIGISPR